MKTFKPVESTLWAQLGWCQVLQLISLPDRDQTGLNRLFYLGRWKAISRSAQPKRNDSGCAKGGTKVFLAASRTKRFIELALDSPDLRMPQVAP
jgi:hypothetical protein